MTHGILSALSMFGFAFIKQKKIALTDFEDLASNIEYFEGGKWGGKTLLVNATRLKATILLL